jgi:hypothetical protein
VYNDRHLQKQARLLLHSMPVTPLRTPPQQPSSMGAIILNRIIHFSQEVLK